MRRWWLLLAGVPLLAAALPVQGQTIRRPAIRLVAASPGLTLSPSSGKPGETIAVSGTGFACHSGKAVAVVSFNGAQQGSAVPVGCTGTFSASFRLPDVALGTYPVSAEGFAPKPSSPPPPSPTPTSTPTATNTSVPTNTAAPTSTATPTATPTNTPVPSPTATPTSTPTPTATGTPTLVATPTNIPTPTPSPTATLSSPQGPPPVVPPNPPNLSVAKAPDAAAVDAGNPIGFTVTVSNGSGPNTGTAVGVTLNDPLPAGPGISWSISPAYSGPGACAITGSGGSQTLTCAYGNLVPGSSASVHVTSGTNSASCGTYSNTASASAANAPTMTATATTAVQCPALKLTKTADAHQVNAGNPIGFTLTASNAQGAGTATGATLNDPLPSGGDLYWTISPPYSGPGSCSISGGEGPQTLMCNFGNLAPGTTASVHVTSDTDYYSCGTYTNTASLSATNAGTVTATDNVQVVNCATFRFARTVNPGKAESVSSSRVVSAAQSGTTGVPSGYSFDGDRASASVTVIAPSAPFTVKQRAHCMPPPTAGQVSTCTITETVTNNSGHSLRYQQVTNQIPNNLTITGQSTRRGTIAPSGHQVRWSGFTLAPQTSTTATIQVTFRPSQSQVGHHVRLSVGISASAVDLVTGQRYGERYGTLLTHVLVGTLPQTGSGGTGGNTGVAALPQTGGGAGPGP